MRCNWLALAAMLAASAAQAGNWPAWRGPAGTGVSSEINVPLEWSKSENIAWRTPLPAPGNSTPIVWGDRVFLTQAVDDGKKRTVMCFDRGDGKLLWQQGVEFAGEEPTHSTNPFCSASPVTDGERIIAWHGSAGIVAYDFDGNELWRRDLGPFRHIWGNASSPVLLGDLVICQLGPGPQSVLVALDKRSGADVWRMELTDARGEEDAYRGSWSTPVVRETRAGPELLVSLPNELVAFDPMSGERRWNCRGLSDLVYTSPLVGRDAVVAMSGYTGPALAVRTGGAGDVTETHRLWVSEKKNDQRVGSGVIVDDHIYIMDEPGFVRCYVVATGELVWEERLAGSTWSSMVHADGRLYIINMDGTTYVLEPGPEFKLLAENPLGELTRGSLALSDGQIFVRTYNGLYCIGARRGE